MREVIEVGGSAVLLVVRVHRMPAAERIEEWPEAVVAARRRGAAIQPGDQDSAHPGGVKGRRDGLSGGSRDGLGGIEWG